MSSEHFKSEISEGRPVSPRTQALRNLTGGSAQSSQPKAHGRMTDITGAPLQAGDPVEIVSTDLILPAGTCGVVNSIQHTSDGSPFAIIQDAMGEDYDWVHVCSDPEEIRKVEKSTHQQVNKSTLAEDGA